MFRTVPLSIIRSFSLYTQQWYMSYRFAGSLRALRVLLHHIAALVFYSFPLVFLYWYVSFACLALTNSQAVSKPVWHIPLLCVQWKTPDDGQRNCPKHVVFYSKSKFEKLLHQVGFIMRTVMSLLKNMGAHLCHGIILWSALIETLYYNLWVKFTLYLFSWKYYLNIFFMVPTSVLVCTDICIEAQ